MTRTTYLSLAFLLVAPITAPAATTTTTDTTHVLTLHSHKAGTAKPTKSVSTSTTRTAVQSRHGKTTTTHQTTTTTSTTTHKGAKKHSAPKSPVPVAPLVPHHHRAHAQPAGPVSKPLLQPAVPVPQPAPKPAPPPIDPNKGSATGLPLPRFAALRSDRVNLRTGPGTRYPIDWQYLRRDLPVKIEREFEVWRLISQPDGTKGWVHLATLTGRRSFLITSDQPQTLRADANDNAAAVAILKPGVVGRLLKCAPASDWCSVEVKTYHGFLNRSAFWGTLPGEAVGQ